MADVLTDREPIAATCDEQAQLDGVARLLTATGSDGTTLVGSIGEPVTLPASLLRVLHRAVVALAQDEAVAIVPVKKLLTADAAADLLNVSRPYLLRLLDRGDIPSVGSNDQLRIALADLLHYKQRRDTARRAALRDLTRMSQEFGLYEHH